MSEDEEDPIAKKLFRYTGRSLYGSAMKEYYGKRKRRDHKVTISPKVRVQEQTYDENNYRNRFSRSSSITSETASTLYSEPDTLEQLDAREESLTDPDIMRSLWFTKILPELEKRFSEKDLILTFGCDYKSYNKTAARIIAQVLSEDSGFDDCSSVEEAMNDAVKESIMDTVRMLAC